MRLLVATTNPKKADEIKAILADQPEFQVVTLKDLHGLAPVVEDGRTFKDNAIKKAVSYAKQSRLLTVSDDSGLCVDALDGAPGVLSARFAGVEQNALANCEKLLKLLEGVSHKQRTARFECHIALADQNGLVATVSGCVEGFIIDQMRGSNGFGYDPIFLYPKSDKTFAEIPSELKNRISHRTRALTSLKPVLSDYLRGAKNSWTTS